MVELHSHHERDKRLHPRYRRSEVRLLLRTRPLDHVEVVGTIPNARSQTARHGTTRVLPLHPGERFGFETGRRPSDGFDQSATIATRVGRAEAACADDGSGSSVVRADNRHARRDRVHQRARIAPVVRRVGQDYEIGSEKQEVAHFVAHDAGEPHSTSTRRETISGGSTDDESPVVEALEGLRHRLHRLVQSGAEHQCQPPSGRKAQPGTRVWCRRERAGAGNGQHDRVEVWGDVRPPGAPFLNWRCHEHTTVRNASACLSPRSE